MYAVVIHNTKSKMGALVCLYQELPFEARRVHSNILSLRMWTEEDRLALAEIRELKMPSVAAVKISPCGVHIRLKKDFVITVTYCPVQ